jgi:membrane protein DedA with SNARE-associated domain
LENWVAQYGGLALFFLLIFGIVGLPVPDEWLLVGSGCLIFRGTLNPIGTWLGAVLGSLCGITFSYIIGRTIGIGFIHSRFGRWLHITDERIRFVHDWFDRIGHWALFVGYYIPGVRHFTALVAGTSGLEFRSFAMYAYSGGCIWATIFLYLGYRFGDQCQQMFEVIHRNLELAAVIAGVLILGYVLVRRFVIKRRALK